MLPLLKYLASQSAFFANIRVSTPGVAPDLFWVYASDYFCCTSEGDGAAALDGLQLSSDHMHWASATMAHLVFRFSALFSSRARLWLALRGLLTELCVSFSAAAGVPHRHPWSASAAGSVDSAAALLRLYSGHDVTLFPLLVFLALAARLAPPRVWPGYASAVTLELRGSGADAAVVWSFVNPNPFPAASAQELQGVYSDVAMPLSRFLDAVAELRSAFEAPEASTWDLGSNLKRLH